MMNNEINKSAVEWMYEQLFNNNTNISQEFSSPEMILKRAKEMEKEQIKSSWNHGFDWGMMEQSLAEQGEPSTLIDANHFYNETYGGNK